LNLCRKHEDIANRRRDWFWKLAHRLTDQFDVLYFEALNLKGMQRLWGKKVSDRDENAAKNIKMGGSPSIGLGDVRLARPAISA
jgi:transposase